MIASNLKKHREKATMLSSQEMKNRMKRSEKGKPVEGET